MSLKKRRQQLAQSHDVEKVGKNLHLVNGEIKHKITSSTSPLPADEIEKLNQINPALVDRLFSIVESSLNIENEEMKNFYAAVQREQENEKLSIITQSNDRTRAMRYSFVAIFALATCGVWLLFKGFLIAGGAMVTTVLLGVVKAFLSKKEK